VPGPRIGSLIWFRYLWAIDANAGQIFGKKLRRCVVIGKVQHVPDGPVKVMVAPITHLKPDDTFVAIEVSAEDAIALRLDNETSWIIVDDINYFTWVGPDIEQDQNTGAYEVGFLAPSLFQRVTEKFNELTQLRRTKFIARDDKPSTGKT
jgi:hypothetical protein